MSVWRRADGFALDGESVADNRFDRLTEDCAADGVYEFFFVAPPLPFTGAVGSPLNAYAIK